MQTSLRILIVGGGIAGLTLATALRRHGFHPDLIERAPEWAPAGAGITLGINAMRVLAALELADDLLAVSYPLAEARITDAAGRSIARTDFRDLSRRFGPSVAIHRADLHARLLKGAGDAAIRMGLEPRALNDEAAAVRVEFSDGSSAEYDLVVGADGIRSAVRTLRFGDLPLHYSGYTCWRFLCPNPGGVTVTTEMWGRGRRFGIVPLPGDRLYCFATLNAPGGGPDPTGRRFLRFRELFSDFGGDVPAILHAAPEETRLIHNDLEELRLTEWFRGRVALIGDAAHAMTPNMGQGAAMAIEDAFVLAEELGARDDLPAALAAYQLRRFPRADKVRRQSWQVGRLAQTQNAPLASARDTLFRLIPDRFAERALEQLLTEKI